MAELQLTKAQYLELEKIGLGAFAPLDGFMNEDDFHSVVDTMRLKDGSVFPLPITLPADQATADRLKGASSVTLIYEGVEVGTLDPQSFYSCDKDLSSTRIFGTNDMNHPGVAYFHRSGDVFIGGPTKLTKRVHFDYSEYELTPSDTKAYFKNNGWTMVAGFQTRNVPHRAHEYLQKAALEHVDGLFIQPLIGWKKKGDFTPEAVLTGYKALIDHYYKPDKVLLGVLSTNMRYAGPREAVFHAILRRNYGCTHFIVGRDHAGVGDYYGKYDGHDLTRRFDGELGIEVMRMHGPYYCKKCDSMVTEHTCPHLITAPEVTTQISGTDMRAILVDGRKPDPHLMRKEVVDSLASVQLFVEEDE